MKKYIQIVLIFLLFLMLIPMIALLTGKRSEKPEPGTVSRKLECPETVKILDEKAGSTIEVSFEDYIVGAVAAQMPYSFEEEALKAQAVLAQTYIISRRLSEQSDPTDSLLGADISRDTSVYQPYCTDEEINELYGEDSEQARKKIKAAVKEVLYEVAVYDDMPIISAFHGISSGFTESAENAWGIDIPYLVSVESECDPSSPDYSKKYIIDDNELKEKLNEHYPDIKFSGKAESWLDISETSRGGTVLSIGIGDDKTMISGYDFMKIFDLRSPCFKFTHEGGSFTITVCGCGHLVGMSQNGANEMAKLKKTYKDILRFYFKGIEIQKLKK